MAARQMTPFEVLGVSPSSSKEQMRRAYHRKLLILHPDKALRQNKENNTFSNKYEQLQKAWQMLQNGYCEDQSKNEVKECCVVGEVVTLDEMERDGCDWYWDCRCGETFVVSSSFIENWKNGGSSKDAILECGGCSLGLQVAISGSRDARR